MPFWLKWVALPIIGLFVVGSVITWIVGSILHLMLYVAIGAVAVVAIMHVYRKTIGELPAAKRRKRLERSRRGY
jgi:cell division protein FtsL